MKFWRALAAVVVLTMMAGGIAMAQVVLAKDGKSLYRIVVPQKAIPSERYAAEELQRYLERISGAKLPIVTDSEPMGSHEILLGDNAHLRKLGIQFDFAKLGADGFVLRTFQNHLIIAGGRPRGTLYGVYALLEEKLGVRWFTPEVEFVPKMERVELPVLNETQVPALEYREVFWTEMMRDPDFAARHRLNGHHYRLTEKHGGRAVVFYPFVHSFDLLIPREICEQRLEFWPMIGGRRVSGYVQRCLSNPDLVKLAIERVKQWIKEHPEATIIDVSQNDTWVTGVNALPARRWTMLKEAHRRPSSSSSTRLLKPLNGNIRTFALRRWHTNTAASPPKLCARTKMSSFGFAQLNAVSLIPLRPVHRKRTGVFGRT